MSVSPNIPQTKTIEALAAPKRKEAQDRRGFGVDKIFLLIVLLYLLIPLATTLAFSLTDGAGITLAPFGRIFSDPDFATTFPRSLELALASTILVIVLVTPTAYWIQLRLPQARPIMDFLTLVPFGVPAIVMAFARASREIYLSIQQEHDIGVQTSESLYIASTETERVVLEEFAQAYGTTYNCSYLDASEARYRYPFIQASYCKGALVSPDDLTLEPRRMLRQFITHIAQKGLVEYLPQTMVVAVELSGRECIVKDAKGNVYTADRIFVCNGAEYRTLFPEFFKASELRVCKLQMMQTVAQPRVLPHAILSGLSIRRYPAFKSCPSYRLLQEQQVDERVRNYGIHLLVN